MSTEAKATPKARLMNQKQIQDEYGIPTRDVLRAVQAKKFPDPVRVLGKVRWFRRADIAKFFKDQGGED